MKLGDSPPENSGSGQVPSYRLPVGGHVNTQAFDDLLNGCPLKTADSGRFGNISPGVRKQGMQVVF